MFITETHRPTPRNKTTASGHPELQNRSSRATKQVIPKYIVQDYKTNHSELQETQLAAPND
jgi:hypothetical protein